MPRKKAKIVEPADPTEEKAPEEPKEPELQDSEGLQSPIQPEESTPPPPDLEEEEGSATAPLTLDQRLTNIEDTLKSLPDHMAQMFQNYTTKYVEPRLQQLTVAAPAQAGKTGGLADILGPAAELIKAFSGGGGDSEFQAQVSDWTKDVVRLALRGSMASMRRSMGIPDHVTID